MSKLRSRKIDYVVIYCKPGGVSNGFAQTSSRNLLAKKLQKSDQVGPITFQCEMITRPCQLTCVSSGRSCTVLNIQPLFEDTPTL